MSTITDTEQFTIQSDELKTLREVLYSCGVDYELLDDDTILQWYHIEIIDNKEECTD